MRNFVTLFLAICFVFFLVPQVKAQDDFVVAKIVRTLEKIEKRIDALEESQAELRTQVNSLRASSLSTAAPAPVQVPLTSFSSFSSSLSAYSAGAGGGCSTGSCGTGGMMRGRRGR